MPSTHTQLLHHLIFATKNREPWISESWRARLHEYLGGCVNRLDGMSQGVGGVADHVHLLVGLKPTHRLSDLMRELKKASSAWVRQELSIPGFAWQEGYSAFTVSAVTSEAIGTCSLAATRGATSFPVAEAAQTKAP